MTFTDDGRSHVNCLIDNRFCRDGLVAKLNARRNIENGKAIFHAETLPVEVGHHVLNTGVILEAVGREIFSVT